jgi:hypothetical protein
MPYVPGGTSQGDSGLAEVKDVYAASNVYINNVLVALWQPPGQSAASSSLSFKIPESTLFSRPDSPQAKDQHPYTPPPPGQAPTPAQNAEIGVKPSTPGDTQAPPIEDQPPTKCEGGKPNVLGFLSKCLEETKTGTWRETGQGGKPSNPNILGIWKNIGLGFNSDQVPWCAGFACFAMKQSGLKWIREAGAKNLANKLATGSVDSGYKEVSISEMKPGDLVLWGTGHVNFCYTASGGKYTFVGGNQMPGRAAEPPVRDPNNDGDVTVSWPSGWTPSRGGITKVVRLDC